MSDSEEWIEIEARIFTWVDCPKCNFATMRNYDARNQFVECDKCGANIYVY